MIFACFSHANKARLGMTHGLIYTTTCQVGQVVLALLYPNTMQVVTFDTGSPFCSRRVRYCRHGRTTRGLGNRLEGCEGKAFPRRRSNEGT